jgi:hypothetical protein
LDSKLITLVKLSTTMVTTQVLQLSTLLTQLAVAERVELLVVLLATSVDSVAATHAAAAEEALEEEASAVVDVCSLAGLADFVVLLFSVVSQEL